MTWTWHDDDPATALSAQNMQKQVELRLRALEAAGGGAYTELVKDTDYTLKPGVTLPGGSSDGDFTVIRLGGLVFFHGSVIIPTARVNGIWVQFAAGVGISLVGNGFTPLAYEKAGSDVLTPMCSVFGGGGDTPGGEPFHDIYFYVEDPAYTPGNSFQLFFAGQSFALEQS